jgi:hypothetical protein
MTIVSKRPRNPSMRVYQKAEELLSKCHLQESFAVFYEKVCHVAVKYDESAIRASQATKVLPNVLLLPIQPQLLQITLQSRLRTLCSCGKTFGKKRRNIIVNGSKRIRVIWG